MTKKFDYHIEELFKPYELHKLGEQGWELVTILVDQGINGNVALFKREVEEEIIIQGDLIDYEKTLQESLKIIKEKYGINSKSDRSTINTIIGEMLQTIELDDQEIDLSNLKEQIRIWRYELMNINYPI